MYSMVTTVNNTVIAYLEDAKWVDLKSSHCKKKNVTMCNDGL